MSRRKCGREREENFRNDRRKQIGGFENDFWRRLIAPTGNRAVVVGGRRSAVVQSVATVPIRWKL